MLLGEIVAEAGPALAGQTLSISQVITDPPAHLLTDGAAEITWSMTIAEGRASVTRGGLPNPAYSERVNYAAILPGARRVAGAGQERQAQIAAGLRQIRGSLDQLSPTMRQVLVELHDRLAARTA